jgi:hypothetical protein
MEVYVLRRQLPLLLFNEPLRECRVSRGKEKEPRYATELADQPAAWGHDDVAKLHLQTPESSSQTDTKPGSPRTWPRREDDSRMKSAEGMNEVSKEAGIDAFQSILLTSFSYEYFRVRSGILKRLSKLVCRAYEDVGA